MSDPTVADVDEDGLLAAFLPEFRPTASTLLGPGDDAAVVAAPDGRFVVTTDILVEDNHFVSAWSTGEDVGWRAAMQNLADVAAMGASPSSVVVALGLPAATPVAWVRDFARGLARACARWGAAVVGGDLSSADKLTAAVTAHGDLGGGRPVVRTGARPGDVLAYSGVRGWSNAGLDLLLSGAYVAGAHAPAPGDAHGPGDGRAVVLEGQVRQVREGRLDVDAEMAPFVRGYLRPDPPVGDGRSAREAGATAMLDVSDGLLRDAGRIAAASRVRIVVDFAALADDAARLVPAARRVAARGDVGYRAEHESVGRGKGRTSPDVGEDDRQPDAPEDAVESLVERWVLAGGEDHGLLATFPPGAALPASFRAIGRVIDRDDEIPAGASAPEGGLLAVTGTREPLTTLGWDHFGV